jgi:hypothetical protein
MAHRWQDLRGSWLRVGLFVGLSIIVTATLAAAQTASRGSGGQGGGTQTTGSAMENLNFFIGLDGSKSPQDLGINANMGVRFSVNWGLPVSRKDNLGAQIGVAANLSDAAVHVLDQVEGTSRRMQTYVTAGVFQRTLNKITWAAGFDLLMQDYYDTNILGQLRGQIGYALSDTHEMGAWMTKGVLGEDAQVGATNVRLEPISQINGFSSHVWPSNARTTIWVGLAAGHDNVVLTVSDEDRKDWVLVYGAELHMPLSDRFAVTGAANFLTPTATGTVDAFLGVVFYPGRTVMKRTPPPFSPVMTVGNSPMFPVNLALK